MTIEPVDTSAKKPPNSFDVEKDFQKLLAKCKAYMHDENIEIIITKAYHYAAEKHKEQFRRSGEPYIIHPIAVATILTELNIDLASIIAAILHDVVEDTDTPLSEIEKEFGPVVANLVDGLTKIGKIQFRSSQEKLAENFRKMVLAMAKDLRVIIVKLADRLHNMRTLDSLSLLKRRKIAQETLDIYAPLANRLGIYEIKSELEDLCLRETKYDIYQKIKKSINSKKTERESYIEEIRSILQNELRKYGFKDAVVYGRSKHFYSIYKKMLDRKIAFEDLHDLFAFRIIVDSIKDCYEALGIVHTIWKPMPGRFKDYIAMPKANLYQSLHTTVIRPDGEPAEIQIRTKDMHSICEHGVAAHWAYKEKQPLVSNKDKNLEKFSWLRQIMEWQSELKDPDEFLEAVKVDLFEDEIFVFTPKGDVIQLGSGATALDFAFAVHTDIGQSTVSAKINGRITPLRSTLKSGDIIEVTTSAHQKPSKDWLNFVVTSKAKNKIRSYLRSEQRVKSKELGYEVLEQTLTKRSMNIDKLFKSGEIEQLVKSAKESKIEDVLIGIGYGKYDPDELILKAFPELQPKEPTLKELAERQQKSTSANQTITKKRNGVLVGGLDDILVSFSKCCSPLPGEDIIGFITRGQGVSVHKGSCSRALDLDPARRIQVSWAKGKESASYHTSYLQVITHDRHGVLADVTAAISAAGANILKAQIHISPDMKGILDFEVNLKDVEHLNLVLAKVESIPDVVHVIRKNAM